MKARPYQLEAIENARAEFSAGARSVLICKPTGTGKGFVIGEVMHHALAAGSRVLAFCHREEIIEQLVEHAERSTGIRPAIERAHLRQAGDMDQLVVGSVPSLINRLDRLGPNRFDLLIADEAHHALAASWMRLFEHFSSAKILGFTATPNRGDELALGQVFERVAFDMSLPDAIREGWLVPIRQESIDVGVDFRSVRKQSGELRADDLERLLLPVLRDVVEPAVTLAANRQALVFTVTRKVMHATASIIQQIVDERALDLTVATVDGTTPKDERREIMRRFRAGEINWLVNVEVATEGFDAPNCDTIVMLRPTLSRALYMQMIGRSTRPLPGIVDGPETPSGRRAAIRASAKPYALVIDFTSNSGKHELVSIMDLLGGDYSLPEQKEAAAMVERGEADDLLDALDKIRARNEGKIAEARAPAGDPFALFGLPTTKDRWQRKPTAKQRAVLDPLRLPRVLDLREANTVLAELQRRDDLDLSLYVQARLLAQLGHPIDGLREMSRARASALVRELACTRWKLTASWEQLGTDFV
ncbi:MAG TPA: DEAD/DEAH box helicase [Enhygromyxa sp.]|nr:DEAD/DEAH box helicase [Enhygromyxa sp.]